MFEITRAEQIEMAERIEFIEGTRAAAKFLRRMGWSLEAALWLLCRKPSRI